MFKNSAKILLIIPVLFGCCLATDVFAATVKLAHPVISQNSRTPSFINGLGSYVTGNVNFTTGNFSFDIDFTCDHSFDKLIGLYNCVPRGTWNIGPDNALCNHTCTHAVTCSTGNVNDCDPATKPSTSCTVPTCTGDWIVTSCTGPCGGVAGTPAVACVDHVTRLPSSNCDYLGAPTTCTTAPCATNHWVIDSCGGQCGTNLGTPIVTCRDIATGNPTTGCDAATRPATCTFACTGTWQYNNCNGQTAVTAHCDIPAAAATECPGTYSYPSPSTYSELYFHMHPGNNTFCHADWGNCALPRPGLSDCSCDSFCTPYSDCDSVSRRQTRNCYGVARCSTSKVCVPVDCSTVCSAWTPAVCPVSGIQNRTCTSPSCSPQQSCTPSGPGFSKTGVWKYLSATPPYGYFPANMFAWTPDTLSNISQYNQQVCCWQPSAVSQDTGIIYSCSSASQTHCTPSNLYATTGVGSPSCCTYNSTKYTYDDYVCSSDSSNVNCDSASRPSWPPFENGCLYVMPPPPPLTGYHSSWKYVTSASASGVTLSNTGNSSQALACCWYNSEMPGCNWEANISCTGDGTGCNFSTPVSTYMMCSTYEYSKCENFGHPRP